MPYISLTKNISQEAYSYIVDNWVKDTYKNHEYLLAKPSIAEKIEALFLREVASRVLFALLIPITFAAVVIDMTVGSLAGIISLVSFGCLFDEIASNHLKSSGVLVGGPAELALKILRPSIEDPSVKTIFRNTVENFINEQSEGASSKTAYRLALARLPLIALAITVDALISVIALPIMFLTLGYFKALNDIVLGGLGFPEILLNTFDTLRLIQRVELSQDESEEDFGEVSLGK